MITLTDLFCGAGGSSTGAIQIPGIEVKAASNHWNLAVETHNSNHPDAAHICADLSQIDPTYFPATDILWASPECTNHSLAKGKKRETTIDMFGDALPSEAAERSRATMWDVPRFAEVHKYQAVIVENVVDAANWLPFQAWLEAMGSLGYERRIVYLNSMHAQSFGPGAPQSRDRMYVVFWRKGNRSPMLDRINRPAAMCPTCGPVQTIQMFKRSDRRWGRYRAQYIYQCPNRSCRRALEPIVRPALDAIDLSIEGTRIGDRARPLAPKTLRRVEDGIEKYWRPLLVPVEGRDGKVAIPAELPMRTMTTRNETGLAVPFIAELRGGGSSARSAADPLATVTASGRHHGVCTSPLVMRNNSGGSEMTTPASEPIRTITTAGHQSLLTSPGSIDINDVRFRMLEPSEIKRAMDFPVEYVVLGNRREQVRMAGNAVTPPAARDLVGVVAESLGVES